MPKMLYEIQVERQEAFPPDRIAFLRRNWDAAGEDRKSFAMYMCGQIDLSRLCIEIAQHNRLDYVSEEQALNELKLIGWVND